jgi:hypothetical protein
MGRISRAQLTGLHHEGDETGGQSQQEKRVTKPGSKSQYSHYDLMRMLSGEIGNQHHVGACRGAECPCVAPHPAHPHAHSALAQAADDLVVAPQCTGSQFLHATIMRPNKQHGKRETRGRIGDLLSRAEPNLTHAACGLKQGSGDPTRIVGGEEGNYRRDVFGCADAAQRCTLYHLLFKIASLYAR